MITTSGHPKSGCHALVKAIQLLGQPCQVTHIPHGMPVDGKHVFIKRHPRNVLVSWVRFIGQPVTQGTLITAMQDFSGMPLVQSLRDFSGWLNDQATHVTSFEDLMRDDKETALLQTFKDWDVVLRLFEDGFVRFFLQSYLRAHLNAMFFVLLYSLIYTTTMLL